MTDWRKTLTALKKSCLCERAAWRKTKTFRRKLVHSALKSPACSATSWRAYNSCKAGLTGLCHSSGVIYETCCNLRSADNLNVGETGRQVRTGHKEHFAETRYEREEATWSENREVFYHNIHPKQEEHHDPKKQVSDIRDLKIYEPLVIREKQSRD